MHSIAKSLLTLTAIGAVMVASACTESVVALDNLEETAAVFGAIEGLPAEELAGRLHLTDEQTTQVRHHIQQLHSVLGEVSELDPQTMEYLSDRDRLELHHSIISDLQSAHEGAAAFLGQLTDEQRTELHEVIQERFELVSGESGDHIGALHEAIGDHHEVLSTGDDGGSGIARHLGAIGDFLAAHFHGRSGDGPGSDGPSGDRPGGEGAGGGH